VVSEGVNAITPVPQRVSVDSDGVTTGFVRFSVEQVRSFEDRLGKAARKAANGDATTAWLAVGRVMGEMRSIREAQE
jgi:hypothetical protein